MIIVFRYEIVSFVFFWCLKFDGFGYMSLGIIGYDFGLWKKDGLVRRF